MFATGQTSFALPTRGQPRVKFRWLRGMTWAFPSHNWPGGGQRNGIPEDEHWAPPWGGPVSMPGSEGQLRTSLPSDTDWAAGKGTWSPQPREKAQRRSVCVSMACWCSQGPSTCEWCSAGGMNLSSWPWRRSLWDRRGNTGLEFMILRTVDRSLVFESLDLKSLVLSLWVTVGKPKGAWFCLHRPDLHDFVRTLATKTVYLSLDFHLFPAMTNTEMHLEIRWRDRKREKKEKDENGKGRKLSWKQGSQFPPARH